MALITVAEYTRLVDTLRVDDTYTYTQEDGSQRIVTYKSKSFIYRTHRLMPKVADMGTYSFMLHNINRGYDTAMTDTLYNFTWGDKHWVSLNIHQVARFIAL